MESQKRTEGNKKTFFSKGLLLLSMTPYVLILLLSIGSAFFGFTFLSSTSYGWEAFSGALVIFTYGLCTVFPILPVAVCYQAGFLIYVLLKKAGVKKVNGKIWGWGVFAVILLILGLIISNVYAYELWAFGQKFKVRSMAKKADEIILYKRGVSRKGGILGIAGHEEEQLLVDYDSHRVGFLIYRGQQEYHQYQLETAPENVEAVLKKSYHEQARIPLSAPGKYLVTYCEEGQWQFYTNALVLIMENGEVYYLDPVKDTRTGYSASLGVHDIGYLVNE